MAACSLLTTTDQRRGSPPALKRKSVILKSHKRLSFLTAILFVECVFAAHLKLEALGAGERPTVRRHVLVVTVDTLRADYVSAYGYDRPTTPFLDSLMAQGARFSSAITPIARTTPALGSLMTGCYPHTSRVRNLTDALPPAIVPLAELARQKGYTTVGVVSNYILQHRGLDRGFDVYDVSDHGRDAAVTTDLALRYLEKYERDRPLFVWVHYIDPHMPYYPPPQLAEQFDPGYDGPYKLHFGDMRGSIMSDAYPTDLPKVQAIFQNRLPERVNAHVRRLYAADIRHTDDYIARLIKGLRAQFGNDWLIVFTADHGEALGEHHYFYEHGDYVFNPELHVPLAFVFPPGDPLRHARVIDARVSLVDVMPTIMELLEMSRPQDIRYTVEGRSLVPYLWGAPLPERPLFAESGKAYFPQMVPRRVRFDVSGRFRAVVLGNWKLIWTPGRSADDQFELYNLADDPGETTNIYGSNRAAAAGLEGALRTWSRTLHRGAPAAQEAAVSPRDMEILRSLGYAR